MNEQKINRLIEQRNKLLQRRDGLYDHERVNRIDAQLSAAVPPGQRQDVDLLLGRVLPNRSAHDIQHMHQCGWCGEWYIGARVDHGCPAPDETQQSAVRWSSDSERAEAKDHGEAESARLAAEKIDNYLMTIADQYDDMMDWHRIIGDLAL